MFTGMESLNIAFVIDDVAHTFELDSFTKGLVGGTSFFGETIPLLRCCDRERDAPW